MSTRKSKRQPWQSGRVPFQVFLEPEVRHALRTKALEDRESMQAALQRLTEMYIAGQLPQAEPRHEHP